MFFHIIGRLKLAEVYLIRRKDFVSPRFFLQEWEYERYNFAYARWTAHQARANEFRTEEAVETFKSDFLRHYPCEIIRITN